VAVEDACQRALGRVREIDCHGYGFPLRAGLQTGRDEFRRTAPRVSVGAHKGPSLSLGTRERGDENGIQLEHRPDRRRSHPGWAVNAEVSGIDVQAAGVILVVVGIIGLIASLVFWSSWGGFGNRDATGGGGQDTTIVERDRPV